MKKFVSVVLCLLLVFAVVTEAGAASYLQFSRLKRVAKDATTKELWDAELNGTDTLIANFESDNVTAYGIFRITGNNDHIVSYLFLGVENSFEMDRMQDALLLCNSWNDEYRTPRAYLDFESNRIVLDSFLFCSEDVTDGMLAEFVDYQILSTKQFIKFASEKGYTVFDDMQ